MGRGGSYIDVRGRTVRGRPSIRGLTVEDLLGDNGPAITAVFPHPLTGAGFIPNLTRIRVPVSV